MTFQDSDRTVYFGRLKPIPVIVFFYWLAMTLLGTGIINGLLLTAAIAFGLLSIEAAGGIKQAPGLLNFILVLKFLLIAIFLKSITLQAADSYLDAPRTTCEVMALGFFGLYLGSIIYRRTVKVRGVVSEVNDPKMYLALAIVFSIACLGSAYTILAFQEHYTTLLQGGLWGIAHQFGSIMAFCVGPAMYYAWSSGSKKFLSHPLVVAILIAELGYGLASTTKQGAMEPLLCYFGVGFIRYGIRSKAVWILVSLGALAYLGVVYPYSQYVRGHGGRDGSLKERLQAIEDVLLHVSTDAEYRQMVDSNITDSRDYYLEKDSFRPIERFAMIGPADLLISSTDTKQAYTGWETIIDGFKLAVPSFLIEDRGNVGVANKLGKITGDVAEDDWSSQMSYGFMANFYNAFGLKGVFFGTIIFIAAFYYVLRLWFAKETLSFGPYGSTVWYILVGMLFEHSLVEAPVGYIIPSVIVLSAPVGLVLLSRFIVAALPNPRSLAYWRESRSGPYVSRS